MNISKSTIAYVSVPGKMSRPIAGADLGPVIVQEVVDRWKICCQRVISLNSADEAATVAASIANIEVVVQEDGPRVKISTIADHAIKQNCAVTVIANADCIPIDIKLISDIIAATEPDDLIMLRRSNLNPQTSAASREIFHGVDAFIIGRNVLAGIPREKSWAIGDAVWDIWLPMLAKYKGFNVFGTQAHLLGHFDHPTRSSYAEFQKHARLLLVEIPMDAPIFGNSFRDRIIKIGDQLTDKNVQHIFNAIAEMLYQWKSPLSHENAQFGNLWMKTLKHCLGPDDAQFHQYTQASGHPIRRWLLKTIPRLTRYKN